MFLQPTTNAFFTANHFGLILFIHNHLNFYFQRHLRIFTLVRLSKMRKVLERVEVIPQTTVYKRGVKPLAIWERFLCEVMTFYISPIVYWTPETLSGTDKTYHGNETIGFGMHAVLRSRVWYADWLNLEKMTYIWFPTLLIYFTFFITVEYSSKKLGKHQIAK